MTIPYDPIYAAWHDWPTVDTPITAAYLQGVDDFLGKHTVPVFNVTGYGAVGDGDTDDTDAIQDAIDAVPATGGTVYFPALHYHISSTLNVNRGYINLVGDGRAGDVNESGTNSGTTIRWVGSNGGGPMFSIEPSGTGLWLRRVTMDGLTLQGSSGTGNIAATGLSLKNVGLGRFGQLEIRNCSTVALDMNDKVASGGARGVAYCLFEQVDIRQDQFGAPNGHGFRLDGGNDSGNAHHNLFSTCSSQHYNGTAWKLNNCDTNLFIMCSSKRGSGGSGIGLEFNGSDTAGNHARYNTFFGFSQQDGPSSVVSRATGFDHPAVNNVIWSYTQGNSNPLPTIESGSSLTYVTDNGQFRLDGSSPKFGIAKAPATVPVTVTGSRGGNAALASLLTALASLGWITDSTS